MKCKYCGSPNIKKSGSQKRWKGGVPYHVQMRRCNDCGRQWSGERVVR